MDMQFSKRLDKMRYVKIIFIVIIVIASLFVGYQGYLAYQKWEADRFNEMAMLKSNQDLFLKKVTDLSVTITKIVNDTVKVQTVTKENATYEGLKEQVIELQKDEEANKEEIEKLRAELSIQRKAFLASDDTILIKTEEGEKILLYRDEEGNLQPASEGIVKIIEHKSLSEDVPILAEEKIALDKTSWNIKAGGYYSLNKTYGVIISKGIFTVKDYSLNASLLVSDFEDVKFAIGADVGYLVGDNLEIGAGYNSDKEVYFKLQYTF